MGRHTLQLALDTGVLAQIWRGVVIRADSAVDVRTRAAAAMLAVGPHAVLSGPTAVALHGYDAAGCGDIHLTVPYSHSARSRPGLVLHQDRFDRASVVRISGLPVFARHHALAELACRRDSRMAIACLDQALKDLDAEGKLDLKREIHAHLEARDDRRGIAKASMLTELATGKADSPPESHLLLLLTEASFPIPEPQIPILAIDGRVLFVLDLGWEQYRIGVEYDGVAAHEFRADYDADRDAWLAKRGWIIIRATAEDLQDPARLLSELREAFRRRAR